MTTADRIARVRAWGNTGTGTWTAPRRDALALCDAYEALEAERAEVWQAGFDCSVTNHEVRIGELLAERDELLARCSLSPEEAEAVRRWVSGEKDWQDMWVCLGILKRLLGEPPHVKHRWVGWNDDARCSCGWGDYGNTSADAAVRAWAAHAGIGGTG